MHKVFCIVIALTIAAAVASAGEAQQPSPEPDPYNNPTNPNQNIGGLGDHPPNPIQMGPRNFPGQPSPIQRIIVQEDTHAMTLLRRQVQRALSGRSPDTSAPVVVTVAAGGFDWGDAGIGSAAAVALALLCAGGAVLVRDGRRQKAHG